MARRLEVVREEELGSHPVMLDLKNTNETTLLNSYKNKPKSRIKKILVITAIVVIALLYAAARLRI
jgi:hypothetical protein